MSDSDWRVVSSPQWLHGRWGAEAMLMLARETRQSRTHDYRSAGFRLAYGASAHWKLQAEAGATWARTEGSPRARLHKLTLAPTLALAPDYWSRPELRFYVTQAWWNRAALASAAFNTTVSDRQNGTTWGTHFETWF
jgi:maltoporin